MFKFGSIEKIPNKEEIEEVERQFEEEKKKREKEKDEENKIEEYRRLLNEDLDERVTRQIEQRFFEKGQIDKVEESLDSAVYNNVAIWINKLYQERILKTSEAEFLMNFLHKETDNGKDHYVMIRLINLLDQVDLYKKEGDINE